MENKRKTFALRSNLYSVKRTCGSLCDELKSCGENNPRLIFFIVSLFSTTSDSACVGFCCLVLIDILYFWIRLSGCFITHIIYWYMLTNLLHIDTYYQFRLKYDSKYWLGNASRHKPLIRRFSRFGEKYMILHRMKTCAIGLRSGSI